MSVNKNKRALLTSLALGSCAAATLPTNWTKPIVNSVLLPTHAQTTDVRCDENMVTTGPIEANPFGATNCADACDASAKNANSKLCRVESNIVAGKEECSCYLDATQLYGD